MITKRSISKPNSIEEFGEIAISKKKPKFLLLASTIQFSNHHAPHVSNPPRREQAYSMWASNRTTIEHRGVAVREPKSIPIPLPDGTNPIQAIDLFHTSIPMQDRGTIPRARGSHRTRNRVLKFSVERR